MLPGDRLICGFVETLDLGAQFQTWLPHLTIVPWFRLDEASGAIAKGLERALYGIVSFDVMTDGVVQLGPRKNRPVRLIRPTKQLAQIETKVRTYLHKKRAFLIDETTKMPHQFRPHVTAQGGFLLPERMTLHIDRFYIVEQVGGCKKVTAVFSLGNLTR
jgi:hypothetical protein